MESVRFEGTSGLDPDVLEDSIATQETRCRGFILRPFCAITDSGIFLEKHYLDREELDLDELRIRVIYFRRGYRQARVESSLAPEDDGVAVTFTIAEGPLTRIEGLAVIQTDSLLSPEEIRRAELPPEGGPLDLTLLDSARIRLRNRLWDRGHADAEVRDSVVIVDSLAHAAFVRVHVDPGPVTTIGEVVIEGNERVSDHTVRRLFELGPGDLYRRSDMTRAQRRLYETELFRQSIVRVPPTPDSAKTVRISVREAPLRAIRAGGGVNTVEFVQGEGRLTRYNWMGGARRLDVRAAVGNLLAPQLYGRSIFDSAVPAGIGEDVDPAFLEPTWHLGANVTQPFFISSRNSLGLGVSAHRRSIPGIVIDRGLAANASFTRQVTDGLPISLTYQFEETRVEAGDVYFCVSFGVCDPSTIASLGQPHRLSPVKLSARLDRTDDPLLPTRGYAARVELEHASRLTLSDFQYQRATAEVSHHLGLGPGVLAGRARAGWLRPLDGTTDRFELPEESNNILHPRRRLTAGGSRSVRGYGENQLGPRVLTIPAATLIEPPGGVPGCTAATIADRSCDPDVAPSDAFEPRPLGGNTLLEASVEYRHPISESVTAAVFVDAGMLRGQRLNVPPGSRSAVTPGVGIRYRSRIGPVRLDLGLRPSLGEELPVVTEVVSGDGESRLVQLETLKHYDPSTDRGFLGGILSRLQLHLAIGEAF